MKYLLAAGILFNTMSAFARFADSASEVERKAEVALENIRPQLMTGRYVEISGGSSNASTIIRLQNNETLAVDANYLAVMGKYCDSMSVHFDHGVVVCMVK